MGFLEKFKKIIKEIFPKKRVLVISKVIGFIALYCTVFIVTVYFTMYSMIKSDEIKVPNLIGLDIKDVMKIAKNNKFRIRRKVGYFKGDYNPSTVIDQSPEKKVNIKKNSFVIVYITADIQKVTVPDLEGFTIGDAEKKLEELNLRKRYISYMESKNIPSNLVIGQSYSPGELVNIRRGIDLLVSKGRRKVSYVMPDLIGKSLEEVKTILAKRGLKIAEFRIERINYPLTPQEIVISQSPKPGFRISSNNLIDLKVSK